MLLSSVCVTVVEGRNFCCCDASIVLLKPHKAKLLLQDHLLLHRPYKQLFKPGFYKYEMSYDVATLWAIFYFFSPNNSFFFRVQIRSKKLMTTQQVACLSDHVLKLEWRVNWNICLSNCVQPTENDVCFKKIQNEPCHITLGEIVGCHYDPCTVVLISTTISKFTAIPRQTQKRSLRCFANLPPMLPSCILLLHLTLGTL